jgi:hypothetical protein
VAAVVGAGQLGATVLVALVASAELAALAEGAMAEGLLDRLYVQRAELPIQAAAVVAEHTNAKAALEGALVLLL